MVGKEVKIKTIWATHSFKVKPLSSEDLQELISLAMKTGWYGNIELLKFVAERGFTDSFEATQVIDRADFFTLYNTVREIWILTLQALAKKTNKLLTMLSDGTSKLSIKRYKYTDLATPGLLWFIISVQDRF